jgi:hypothetical protein
VGCVGLLSSVRRDRRFVALIAAAALIAPAAQAAVIITSGATQNMSCSNGVCAPTAAKAVLNAGDLETLLASGNATVTTTGQGVQAHDIDIRSPVTWSSSSVLTLDARRSLIVDQPVSITGLSGLAVQTGRMFSFGNKGNVTFANLASSFSIDGAAYTLAGDIKTLASDIASDPGGDFALANSYDASGDGTYHASPIGILSGTFEGLGNTISNLSIDGPAQVKGGVLEGLFAEIDTTGTARNIDVSNANISVPANIGVTKVDGGAVLVGLNLGTLQSCVATGSVVNGKSNKYGPELGGLASSNGGTISYSRAAVKVNGIQSLVGGLVGYNGGSISQSSATGDVSGPFAGGLVGDNPAIVTGSYATGRVRARDEGGGLIGSNLAGSTVTNSYATGSVTDGADYVGGLIGYNEGTISSSYSTGHINGTTGSLVGGVIGYDGSLSGSLDATYWDLDTSGITDPSQGAGNIANDPGITGLTTAQFQSGLPAGFEPTV